MRQVEVYGAPFICHSDECKRYAVVIFRNLTAEGEEMIILCKTCWRDWRNAYRRAENDINATVRFGGREYNDDGENEESNVG